MVSQLLEKLDCWERRGKKGRGGRVYSFNPDLLLWWAALVIGVFVYTVGWTIYDTTYTVYLRVLIAQINTLKKDKNNTLCYFINYWWIDFYLLVYFQSNWTMSVNLDYISLFDYYLEVNKIATVLYDDLVSRTTFPE